MIDRSESLKALYVEHWPSQTIESMEKRLSFIFATTATGPVKIFSRQYFLFSRKPGV